MDIENYQESCAACGSRTIHFVIDPPDVRRYCAGCGRDNSTTWGFDRLPRHQGPGFDRVINRLKKPSKPIQCVPGISPLVKDWNELSNFERTMHFTDAALHE